MSVVGDLELALQHYPVLMTVEEAGEVLRVGRTLAYALAHRYEQSNGCQGLPVIRIGTCLRVPRWALIELLATGLVPRLCNAHAVDRRLIDADEPAQDVQQDDSDDSASRPLFDDTSRVARAAVRNRTRRTSGSRTAKQLTLLQSD